MITKKKKKINDGENYPTVKNSFRVGFKFFGVGSKLFGNPFQKLNINRKTSITVPSAL